MTYGHLIAGILVLIALVGFVVFLSFPPQPKVDVGSVAPRNGGLETSQTVPASAFYIPPQTVRITYTTSGFSPAFTSVPAGTTIVFQNRSYSPFWPASDSYPANTGYPEEGTCNGHAFDACEPLPPGGTWQFKFNLAGTWGYHDNLSPDKNGIIIVQ